MEIDPRRVQILLAVARYGGVLAAADELRQTASAVSQQISKLEREVGQPLLRRTPSGSVLTSAGRIVAEAADEIERSLEVARSRLTSADAALDGTVVIGGFTSFLRAVLVPRLGEWRERYPQLTIRVSEEPPAQLMREMRRGNVDAAVLEFDAGSELPLPKTFVEEPLLDEPWRLVVPSGTLVPHSLEELRLMSEPWLGTDPTSASAAAVERLQRAAGMHGRVVHHYRETQTALSLVAAGEGVTVLPLLALQGLVEPGVETVDLPGLGTRRVVLRRLARRTGAEAAVDTVVELVRETLADVEALEPTSP
ncbi:LysR family transcriptional regulator [Aeromicrobium alkaliterrae]|uniref:LysR family transcriptional regulator n=1 Tax=Aeromicrobium alkaliterrae TaxID=302168 RepID=A0ABN2K8H8_9ACTN